MGKEAWVWLLDKPKSDGRARAAGVLGVVTPTRIDPSPGYVAPTPPTPAPPTTTPPQTPDYGPNPVPEPLPTPPRPPAGAPIDPGPVAPPTDPNKDTNAIWKERNDPTKVPSTSPGAGYKWVPKERTGADGTKHFYWEIAPDTGTGESGTGGSGTPPSTGGGRSGGGGGGGGGESPAVTKPPLGAMSWWANADSVQPLLRGWAGWLRELMESNPTVAMSNPFDAVIAATEGVGGDIVPQNPATTPDVVGANSTYQVAEGDTLEAIAARYGTTVAEIIAQNPNITNPKLIYAGQTIKVPWSQTPITETGAPLPPGYGAKTPGQPSSQSGPQNEVMSGSVPGVAPTSATTGFGTTEDIIKKLQQKLNIQFTDTDTPTTKWQKFINAIPTADFESQQLLSSLRYDSTNDSWYSIDVAQLLRPEYL